MAKISTNRLGEKKILNNGIVATITRYTKYDDIEITFSDGTIKKTNYGTFKSLSAGYKFNSAIKIGEKVLQRNGQFATLIRYIDSTHIDIKFEDGTIVPNRQYSRFIQGKIVNPNFQPKNSISLNEYILYYLLKPYGFSKIKYSSKESRAYGFNRYEIDIYNKHLKIGIEYDGGYERNHNLEKDMKKSKLVLSSDNLDLLIRIREPQLQKLPYLKGMKVYTLKSNEAFSRDYEKILKKIFQYLNVHYSISINLDFSFTPDFIKQTTKLYSIEYCDYLSRLGEKKIMNCGDLCEITEYFSSNNITVCFEDGTILHNKQYKSFVRGLIKNPNYIKNKRISETYVLKSGEIVTITDYANKENVTVKFEDGYEYSGFTYASIKKGLILEPQYHRIGEKRMMNCGLYAEIIDAPSLSNLTLKFEDGTIVYHKQYKFFLTGAITNKTKK